MADSTGSTNSNYSITMPRFPGTNVSGPLSYRHFCVQKDPAPGRWGGQHPGQRGHQARVRENAERPQFGPPEVSRHVSCFGDRNCAIAAAGPAHLTTAAINHGAISLCIRRIGHSYVKGTL